MEEIPKNNERVIVSPEKQELLRLEAEGKYVFHGTGKDLDELEPRQANDVVRGPEGNPGIFASSLADYAIFMAIFNGRNIPGGARSSAGATHEDDGSFSLEFAVEQNAIDNLKDSASGFVYVFDKEKFTRRWDQSVEYVTHSAIKPTFKIKVSKQDLPQNIEVLEV